MSTKEMICNLITESVPNDELELLYQLVLKFIPAVDPLPDELQSIAETSDKSDLVSQSDIDWDNLSEYE